MKPIVAVDITARDKTEAGQKAAERRFGKFARKTSALERESGLGKLGRQLEGLTKFKKLSFGFEDAGRSVSSIGRLSASAGSQVRGVVQGVLSLGGAAEGALGGIAEGAGVAAGAVAGTVAAVVGLDAAVVALGVKWARTGMEIGQTSRSLGVSADVLQRARAANERYGVSADQTTAALDGLGTTLYDARYGANNLALGAMNQLGVKLKTTKDGAIDVAAAYDDISDAIARQKDPLVQRKLAGIFGMSSALPAIREGSATLKAEGADYAGSGAELSDAQVAEAKDVNRKAVTVRQHLGAIEKKTGMASMSATGAQADAFLHPGEAAHRAITAIGDGATALVRGGAEAGRALVSGARQAGREIGSEFETFLHRIERQESGGHQFEFRRGHGAGPLVSSRGAVGAMQMLPETAARAARYAGIPWDPQRFRTDQAYNEQLGRAELRRLTDKYGGDEVLAAAAYNAGEGRVAQWMKRFGDPRKGQITDAEFEHRIPFKETRDYVANTAKAHVEITLRGAPAGTVTKVTPAPGVDANVNVARSLDGF